ncbi:hypothetical protein LR48_Vigan01g288000 [Vigna angularis]|uniref:Saccharopine dehydrogenase-like C-terminal domain-containing protein n=1 Tax=Phaseolus angularis TaxID=3914 RepID=A0A0L9TT30_PHAAN|nr:hypothetical protein LR48_Vigan01g288000 [Vigna angularis]
MDGDGVICLAVDILPTEFAKEVSLSGHLFDQFLINEALDIIEAAGGSFHLVNCHVGQSAKAVSFSELEVGADDRAVLDQIIDSLTAIAKRTENDRFSNQDSSKISLTLGKVEENGTVKELGSKRKAEVLILGAGRVCQPAAVMLSSFGRPSSSEWYKTLLEDDFECQTEVEVTVGSLYLKDAEQIVEGIPNVTGIQLDVMDHEGLCKYISQVDVVISLLPPSCHIIVANACIELKKHLVTASYVDSSLSMLDDKAKEAGITILGEMGLDPGIGFSEIMGTLSRIGLFNDEAHSLLTDVQRPTFREFLFELLKVVSADLDGPLIGENDIIERILTQGHCKDSRTAKKTAKTIIFLGLLEQTEIPAFCKSAFDVARFRMEERLSYTSSEKDMVLLHHEVEIEYPDSQKTEKHRATLLEFGKTVNGNATTAMALTVGIPAAVGALLLLTNKIQTRGVLRPIEPEVYTPALDIIEAYGIKLIEETE